MKPSRILLILVAIIAGGLAAYLATRGDSTPPPQQAIVEAPRQETQILVARTNIGVGERLSEAKVQWQNWPENAVRPEFITIAAAPEAPAEMNGAVARFEVFAGEPIRQDKLVRSEQGYLSAVLEQGKRGVSIGINSTSSAGGFIVPNDRVDVILTSSGPNGQQSQPILTNVKVLAIGPRLGETGSTGAPADPENPRAEMFTGGTIATLELTPDQADTVINATSLGTISLTLRSIIDFGEDAVAAARGRTDTVRVIRYGVESNVMSNAGPSGSAQPATIDPAAYSQPIVEPAQPVPPAEPLQ